MPEEHGNYKDSDSDDSITDALSSLGWIEEDEPKEELPIDEDSDLKEQIAFFKEQNMNLNDEIVKMRQDYDKILQDTINLGELVQ